MLLKILQVYGCVILYIDNFYKNVIIKKISVNSNYNLYYMYGLDGIVGFTYVNGATSKNYYYRKNLFGDIIAIFDGNGTIYAKYAYDAWGNCSILQDTNGIGTLNPFRYRGYYYDSELNLYYLNARYYDPEIGRFISQDDISYLDPETLNGLNLFAYCLNNPVMGYDPEGCSLLLIFLFLAVTTIVGGVIGGVLAAEQGKKGLDLVADIFLGAAIGLAVGGAAVALTGVVAGAIGGASATVFGGVAAKTAFMIGALAFDFTAFVVAPIYGFSMQAIEYETPKPLPLPNKPQPTPPHPYNKK